MVDGKDLVVVVEKENNHLSMALIFVPPPLVGWLPDGSVVEVEVKLKGSVVCKEFLTRAAKSLKWHWQKAAAGWKTGKERFCAYLSFSRQANHFLAFPSPLLLLLQRLRTNPTLYSCSIVIALLVLFFYVCCFSRAEEANP